MSSPAPVVSLSAAEAALTAIVGGTIMNSGIIEIWSGTQPATTLTSITDGSGGYNLLSNGCTFAASSAFTVGANGGAGSVGGALATAGAIASDTNAAKSGTASFFRAKTSGGTVVLMGSCGTSSADMILNTLSIVAASTIAITAYTIVLPDGTTTD